MGNCPSELDLEKGIFLPINVELFLFIVKDQDFSR